MEYTLEEIKYNTGRKPNNVLDISTRKKLNEELKIAEEIFFKQYPELKEKQKKITTLFDIATIGLTIKEARLKKKMTQSELGNLVNLDTSQISRVEKNDGNTNIVTLLKIFNELDIKMELTIL